MNLVIVESPTKAKTISRFLSEGYKVESSYGHVRDLPKSRIGVNLEHNFEPEYVIPPKARKNIKALKDLADRADKIILATDGDREGEAIAWHLDYVLNPENSKLKQDQGKEHKPTLRIEFHEITKPAIAQALANPREIDVHLVNAQQARRVLDRLVGYKLSPFLWKKVFRGLSAGRVQSVVLRLIADRERERAAFKPEEYWTIETELRIKNKELREGNENFTAQLTTVDGKQLEKLDIKSAAEAKKIVAELEKSDYWVKAVIKKEARRNPQPPFITSTLQRTANTMFGWSSRQTMSVAQGLYEQGFITYMRTDSVNIAAQAITALNSWIKTGLGKRYILDKPRFFKSKSKLAQEAHEAIRPTDPTFAPPALGGARLPDARENKLYDLIWRRFAASQLPPAIFDATSVDVSAGIYGLKATGSIMKFDGYLRVWPSKVSENELPQLAAGDKLDLIKINDEQHFTEPPPRYSEASMIKTLEEYEIGRPSTYASIMSVIQNRNYVEKDEAGRFAPTETGMLVNDLLTENFPNVVDVRFTAEMENSLDSVAQGKEEWHDLVGAFYVPFEKLLEEKYQTVKKLEMPAEKTDEVCEKCGKPMAVKIGRFGKFLACTGFPECKTTKQYITEENSFGECPKCGEGKVITRKTKRRRTFYGCSRYPDCDYASWTKPERAME